MIDNWIGSRTFGQSRWFPE